MPTTAIEIREASESDFERIWPILHEVFVAGETYPHPPETTRDEAFDYWMRTPTATYIALVDDLIAGTYYLRPNQVGLGSHVCNAGYMVARDARGKGVGTALAEHSLVEAARLGFKSMQFNLVVSTNEPSLKIWDKLGFTTVGTLPRAFDHLQLGPVDAYVMYKEL